MRNDSLGDRMKYYEKISSFQLIHQLPIIVRVDGRAFHSVTKGFDKPFDEIMIKTMQETMMSLCEEVSNCRFGYVQSDEISILIYPKDVVNSEAFFSGKIQKIVSITASIATISFYKNFIKNVEEWKLKIDSSKNKDFEKLQKSYMKVIENGVNFDSRCFQLPKEEVLNYFIWRQQDAVRNSIQGLAQLKFSQKQRMNKNCNELQDMLHENFGINWNDEKIVHKRGTACVKNPVEIITPQNETVVREKWTFDYEMPILTQDRNYIENLFIEQN